APTQIDAAMLLGGEAGLDLAFFAWIVQSPAGAEGPLGDREHRALQHLDRLVADTRAHSGLLPRAAAMVPQLLARLRADASSLAELSQHVSRDVTLVAEVIRMANSPYYRRPTVVVVLDHAIQVLGVEGLRSAIARVVLKPLIDVRSGELVARSAKRLWEHTDKKAQLCAALARSKGLDPFEAYLLGLVHNAAWNALLRSIDGVQGQQAWRFGAEFVAALGLRRDRLFAVIARQWQLQDSLQQVALDIAQRGLAADAPAHVLQLYAGDRLAWLLCDPDKARASVAAQTLLRAADQSVRECYDAFVRPTVSQAA
ncbi:MAG: HDOD domain-containing protein, partial [Rhizobacter sp.]|nr:HDOD domain-containing protein [Rhizobacter sp.]